MLTAEHTSLPARQNSPVLDFTDAQFDAGLPGIKGASRCL
jgi:hypothetical protein